MDAEVQKVVPPQSQGDSEKRDRKDNRSERSESGYTELSTGLLLR